MAAIYMQVKCSFTFSEFTSHDYLPKIFLVKGFPKNINNFNKICRFMLKTIQVNKLS